MMWITLTTLLLLLGVINIPHSQPAVRTLFCLTAAHRNSKHIRMNIAAVEKPAFLFISLTLLLNANDFELNPGPAPSPTQEESTSLYLCGACKEPVTWDDMGVMCETCETWYHVFCQGIGESAYERLGNTSIA